MSLHVLGISHRTAGAHERAAFSLDPEQVRELLAHAAATAPDLEVLILSTCNRTEFYLAGEDAVPRWRQLLGDLCPGPTEPTSDRWYLRDQEDAVRHLLKVATGLDSALLGDGQVLGQVRRAMTASQKAGTLGPVLSSCVSSALRAGRQARKETEIGRGAPGVGAAVSQVLQSKAIRADQEVLVLGAGEAGRAVVRALLKAGHRNLLVCNRTASRADELAAELGLGTVAWPDLLPRLTTLAAVVVATAAPRPVLQELLPRAGESQLLVVDAAFPPQVSTEIAGPQVEVVSLESLTSEADTAALARRAAVPAVERIVDDYVGAWVRDQEGRPLELAIKQLHREAERVTRTAAHALAGQSALSAEEIEGLLRRSVRGLLHDHVSRLRSLEPRGPV